MKKPTSQQLESTLARCATLLIPIHLIGSIINGINSIDKGYGHSYPITAYVLIGLWLFIIIAINIFILLFKRFMLSKALRRYWEISSVVLPLMLVGIKVLDTYQVGLFLVLGLLATPYGILFPLLEIIENIAISILIVLLFCILNLIICKVCDKQTEH